MESRTLEKYTIYSTGRIHDEFYGTDAIPKLNKNGYLEVKLFLKKSYITITVQDLIAKLFMVDYIPTRIVVHKDNNIYNNDISNLIQMTVTEFEHKKIADSLPNYKVSRYDPYNMTTDEFNSLDEAVLYMKSTGCEDPEWKIKYNIFNATDDKNMMAYNYKWNSI